MKSILLHTAASAIVILMAMPIALNAQNVGIGTSTPVSKLTIQTPINTTGWTHVGGNDSIIVDESIGGVSATIGTVTNNAFRIKTNDVGRLHIYTGGEVIVGSNTTPAVGLLTVETPNNSDGISHISTSGNILKTRMGGTTAGIGTFSATDMRIYSGGLSRIFISQATGEVSIGTDNTSGGNKLNVQTLNGSYGITHTDGSIRLSTYLGANFAEIGTQSNHPLSFFTNGSTPQMTINTNGSVGIGTFPDVNTGLHINHDLEALRLSGNQPYMTFFNGITYKGYLWNKGTDDMELGTAGVNANGKLLLSIKGTPYVTVHNNGRVSINGPSATWVPLQSNLALTVSNTIVIKDYANNFNEWAMVSSHEDLYFVFNSLGKSYIDVNGDYNTLSDMSLKENLQPYKSVLPGIQKLNVLTYHYKSNQHGKNSFGLIAQNVAAYFPEIVSPFTDKDGNKLLGVSYAKTGVLAIKAIQEQQKIIEQQQQQIDMLSKKLAAIETLVAEKMK